MVRFSDLITKKDEKQPSRKSPQAMSKGENLLLSTPQIARMRKVRGGNVSPVSFDKEEWSSEVVTCYQKFVERAINTQYRVRYNRGISASPILSDLHYILNKDLVEELYEYATLALSDHEEMLVHNVEVTFLSLMIGRGLGYDIKMLLKLGLAAFLENVGMYKIPERILQKRGRLDDEEISVIRQHPTTSYEILAKMGERYQWLAEVAHQVHERSDGSGYPHGLSGAEIYDLSSILGLIDVYVAMIRDRPYRKKFAQTDAIKFIVEETKGLFPAKIREVFLNQISLCPVATHVKLNNKSIGWTSPSGMQVLDSSQLRRRDRS